MKVSLDHDKILKGCKFEESNNSKKYQSYSENKARKQNCWTASNATLWIGKTQHILKNVKNILWLIVSREEIFKIRRIITE